MPPIATVSPSFTVPWVLTFRCEKEGESMSLPEALEEDSGFGIGAVMFWLITMVTTPLGLMRARIFNPTPVLVLWTELANSVVPAVWTPAGAIPLTVGTESPTVMDAGMLSVAITLGADSTLLLL